MENFTVTNETIAIIGIIAIAGISLFVVPDVAENIVLALGGGVVGYLTGTK